MGRIILCYMLGAALGVGVLGAVAPAQALDAPADVLVRSIQIDLDQTITGSWSEIDAVELVGVTEDGTLLRQWASGAEATSQYESERWAAFQATGEPDTFACGDFASAWASKEREGQDSLWVTYETPVYPVMIRIFQTYNPGAIIRVTLLPADGALSPLTVFEGQSANPYCPGLLVINVDSSAAAALADGRALADGVRLDLDQTITGSWNEIDAVELVGVTEDGTLLRQWAVTAEATSQYMPNRWAAMQATGEPDTFACGDIDTAWASLDGRGLDSLWLTYETPVYPAAVNIYQTYNPGAIVRLEIEFVEEGSPPLVIEPITDPGTYCPGVLSVQVKDGALDSLPGFLRLDLEPVSVLGERLGQSE